LNGFSSDDAPSVLKFKEKVNIYGFLTQVHKKPMLCTDRAFYLNADPDPDPGS
jgi:hypothetical protein